MGVGRDGTPGDNYTPGVELLGRQTIFAEGCRGSLTKGLFERFDLRDGVDVIAVIDPYDLPFVSS